MLSIWGSHFKLIQSINICSVFFFVGIILNAIIHCLLSHGVTDITDKCLQYNKVTLPLQMGLMWRESNGKVLLSLCGHSRQLTYWRKVPCATPYISLLLSGLKIIIFEWKLSCPWNKYHSTFLHFIFYAEWVWFFSLLWIKFLFLCGPFESYLAPHPGVGKVMRAQEISTFCQRQGWLRNTFVIVFKGKWEIKYSFLDSLELIISHTA